jgi:ketol-acid reductoisomerase
MRYNIYYLSREYAREHGDPLLGTVEAESKDDAEALAMAQGMGGVVGVWATTAALLPGERIDFLPQRHG